MPAMTNTPQSEVLHVGGTTSFMETPQSAMIHGVGFAGLTYFFWCFYIGANGRLMLFIIGDRTVRLPTVRSVTCWRDHKFYGDTSVCHDPQCWSCRLDIFFSMLLYWCKWTINVVYR